MTMTEQVAAILATTPIDRTGVRRKAADLEAATSLRFTDYAQYGCYPGSCKCPTRFSRCRAWERFEVACRAIALIPEPEKPRIINKYGQDVTGKVYASKSAAINDIYGSLCE